jgi:hypothetical protein
MSPPIGQWKPVVGLFVSIREIKLTDGGYADEVLMYRFVTN